MRILTHNQNEFQNVPMKPLVDGVKKILKQSGSNVNLLIRKKSSKMQLASPCDLRHLNVFI